MATVKAFDGPSLLPIRASLKTGLILGGGERTSPFFAGPRSEVKIVGIDCVAEFFGTDEEGKGILAPETASFVKSANEIYTSSPSLIPVAATFSRFLNGYAAQCAFKEN